MISTYIRQSRHTLRRWALDPGVHRLARGAGHVLAGFCLSAASLEQGMLPLVLGLVWACRGWRAVLVAGGGVLGYGIFWGAGSLQGVLWTGLALAGVLLLGDRRITREAPLLIPATGMLMVSAVGLGFQIFAGDTTSVTLYLIRVALGGAAPWLFSRWLEKREPVTGWFCKALFTLGLAQIAPFPWLGLGFAAAGAAAVGCAFPGAALTGLALDLAGITVIPMTAVTVLAWSIRFLPKCPRWASRLAPGLVGLLFLNLWGKWDLMILPGLFLGGITAGFFARTEQQPLRRGETGAAQVRLELAAEALAQTRRLLQEVPERPVDEGALVLRAVGEACAGCSARDHCRNMGRLQRLPGTILRKPLLTAEELPFRCRKAGRVLAELHRAQEQLRTIRADRLRQQEYREAVVQQYCFLEDFIRNLSDDLSNRELPRECAYDPVVCLWSNCRQGENGDRCSQFAGPKNRYYIILCDGMGTGTGAVREGKAAVSQLQKLLRCGFPAEHALKSLNSLCALRDRAASVTVDLAELELDTGKATVYKWGGGTTWLVTPAGGEKLGEITAPPGLSVTDTRQTIVSLLLKRGQLLLLASDGVEEQTVQEACKRSVSAALLGQNILKKTSGQDDATLVCIQLLPASK